MNDNKVAVITGSSRGIGKAIAKRFAIEGYAVLIHCVSNIEAANTLRDELELQNCDCFVVQADITQKDQAKQLIDTAIERWGKIDVLVNNAGITRDSRLVFMKDEDWNEVINTNLTGLYNVTRSVIYKMIRQRSGTIINLSSVAGLVGIIGQVNYCASKSGIIGFTKALAKEVADYNISVNCIAPGYIESDMTKSMTEKALEEAQKTIPAKCFGKSDDVAELALFLTHDYAKYITGQVIAIDGGLSA